MTENSYFDTLKNTISTALDEMDHDKVFNYLYILEIMVANPIDFSKKDS